MKSWVLVTLAAGVVLATENGNEEATQEAKSLEAVWTVTSVLRNNNELPAERLQDLQLVFRDGNFAFKQGDKTLTAGAFRVDAAKTPPTIDLTTIDGDGNKQTTFAIFDLANDVLKICGARPGEERPSAFAAIDGSGHTLTTCQRVAP